MDPAAAVLNASVHFDRRLLRDDVRGSQAHARMLAAAGLISAAAAEAIVGGLERAAEEIESGARALDPALEDVHMNVESRLTELIGEAGRRLHTARSRNDQVATDLKLYARRGALEIVSAIDLARLALCRQARTHAATLLPGPVAYVTTLTAQVFFTVSTGSGNDANTPGSLKQQQIFPNFDDIFRIQGVTCVLQDDPNAGAGGNIFEQWTSVKTSSRNFNVLTARGIVGQGVNFVAIKLQQPGVDPG